jgi:leucyl/phenylalanyl-tRNA--protein transferase
MQEAYMGLYLKGYASSVEVWKNNELVGGLYGVVMDNVFCGESMFSLVSNTSKVALITLCKSNRFTLIDCQLPNDHLLSMGAVMIERSAYVQYLHA